MNYDLLNSMSNNIKLLNGFDFSQFDDRTQEELREQISGIQSLCRIHIDFELGLLQDD